MSPEPIQPNSSKQQTWEYPNLQIDIVPNEDHHLHQSNDENEYIEITGYLPLAQEPTDSDSILEDDDNDDDDDDDNDDDDDDDDDDEEDDADYEREEEYREYENECTSSLSRTSTNSSQLPSQTIQQSGSSSRSIDLDTDKINQVKSMMANFQLPADTHPEWASTISEEQWKKELIDRIKYNNNF